MRAALLCLGLCFAGTLAACGSDELQLANKTTEKLTVGIHGPRLELRGGCNQDFRTRFCSEEFEPLGVVTVSPGEERLITVFDPSSDDQCTNVLWLRLLTLGEVGPVRELGTQIRLPASIEVELGAGRIHTAAFPQATIRVDEVGTLDDNQGPEPKACADLGRAPR